MAYRNQFDRNGKNSLDGNSAEKLFEQILIKKGYVVRAATFAEQVHDHVDFFAEKDGKVITFDVKARKRISRNDSNPTDEFIWLELRTISGKIGWAMSLVNFIGFERENDFLVVPTLILQEIIKEKCNLNNVVKTSKEALYSSYTRPSRRDQLTIIKSSDILEKSHEIFLK